ncbi:MAG: hypothetical protein F6K47_34305 [Symploca sp. SIO2E6]|nr:hypothetical protein [Symploca sp. SIO2E6]
MSQPLYHNSDSQKPDANPSIQHQADCSKVDTKRATVKGNSNRVIQGNNNRAIQGDENIAIQGENNIIIIQPKKSKKHWLFPILASVTLVICLFFSSAIIPNIKTKNTPIDEGQELLNKGEIKQADEKFDQAKKLDQKSPEPWYWKARLAVDSDNKEIAFEYLEQALTIMPDHSYSLALKIKLLLLRGGEDIKKAQKIATQSHGISSELNSWLLCLEKKEIFNLKSTSELELEQLCNFLYK